MILLNFMIPDTDLWRVTPLAWLVRVIFELISLSCFIANRRSVLKSPWIYRTREILEENSFLWRISDSYNEFFWESWYCIPARPFANLCMPVVSWPAYYSIELLYLTDTAQWMPDRIATYSLLPWEWRQHVPRTYKWIYSFLHGVTSQMTEFFIATVSIIQVPHFTSNN